MNDLIPDLTISQKIKKYIWSKIYYVFPFIQKSVFKLGLLKEHSGRQQYKLGWLKEGTTLNEFKNHLHEKWGFGNHFIALEDEGQVLSWRKLVSFDHQYHLRVFEDGEIRGHFEYTPESKPIKHFKEIGEEDRTDDFKKFLGEFLSNTQSSMKLERDVQTSPQSQITVDFYFKKQAKAI